MGAEWLPLMAPRCSLPEVRRSDRLENATLYLPLAIGASRKPELGALGE